MFNASFQCNKVICAGDDAALQPTYIDGLMTPNKLCFRFIIRHSDGDMSSSSMSADLEANRAQTYNWLSTCKSPLP